MSQPDTSSEVSATRILTEVIQINYEIAGISDLDPLLRKIAKHTRRFVPYEVFAILLIDESNDELYYRFSIGHPPDVINTLKVPVGRGIIGAAGRC